MEFLSHLLFTLFMKYHKAYILTDGWSVCVWNQSAMSLNFPQEKVSFVFLSALQSPETWDSSTALIRSSDLTEVSQAWRCWYANKMLQLQVCRGGFQLKRLLFLVHVSVTHTVPFPVNGPYEFLDLCTKWFHSLTVKMSPSFSSWNHTE